jgi:hypothetical protein
MTLDRERATIRRMPRSPDSPTVRQAEYLSFVRAFTDRWGIPPSFEEIGRHFMTSAPSVNNMIKTLESRGFLTRVPGQARTLRVIAPQGPITGTEPPTDQAKPRETGTGAAIHCHRQRVPNPAAAGDRGRARDQGNTKRRAGGPDAEPRRSAFRVQTLGYVGGSCILLTCVW